MYDIAIIGGGASGLLAAITAKQKAPALQVAILEQEPRVGKKLLVTGNGRCNLTNVSGLANRYYGDTGFAQKVFSQIDVPQTLGVLHDLGISTVELEQGKCFPRSLQAGSVVDQLRLNATELGVEILAETQVTHLQYQNGFVLHTAGAVIKAKAVLLAVGGKSGLGKSPHNGYELAEKMGHSVTSTYPAIVQLTTNREPIRALTGIKVEGTVTATGLLGTRVEWGEILFADYGISGPPVLQVSSVFGKKGTGTVELNLLPEVTHEELLAEIQRRCKQFAGRTCEDLFLGYLNKRVGQTVCKLAGVEKLSTLCGQVSPKTQEKMAQLIHCFPLTVTGNKGWNSAQVTAGGVDTRQVNPHTMESAVQKGLYFAGEILNVTGDCGGFNLQWAWSTGILAGQSMAEGLS